MFNLLWWTGTHTGQTLQSEGQNRTQPCLLHTNTSLPAAKTKWHELVFSLFCKYWVSFSLHHIPSLLVSLCKFGASYIYRYIIVLKNLCVWLSDVYLKKWTNSNLIVIWSYFNMTAFVFIVLFLLFKPTYTGQVHFCAYTASLCNDTYSVYLNRGYSKVWKKYNCCHIAVTKMSLLFVSDINNWLIVIHNYKIPHHMYVN